MTHPSDTRAGPSSLTSEASNDHPTYRSGIGFTQWLALGLVAFSILMVILAIVMNLILGTPGE